MDYDALVAKIIELLQREKRVPYRALKRRFALDDEYIDDLKIDLIEAKRLAIDENDRILVWVGEPHLAEAPPLSPAPSISEPVAAFANDQERAPLSYTPKHLAEKILTSRSALEGERKQVTVLFCDLANSTPLAERLGPEHMHTLLNRFFELALDAVHRYEGTINQFLGDGFMALFGAPLAHEDHARRTVLAALTLQRTLQEADLGKPYGEACQFRMGLNSGLVVVGSIGDNLRMDYSAIGDTTNLAARLQQGAAPDTIWVSEGTSRLVQGYIRLEPLQPIEVKGKAEPVPVYKVMGTLPRRSPIASRSERILSPFVGRERDVVTLEALFAQVEAGHGHVVGIVAEAGGGKSRLLYEFRQRLQDKRITYLEGRCLSYGSTIPYHPLIDVLRHHCGISETESPEALIEKVHVALQEVGMDAEGSAPYLLQLLGVKEGTERLAPLNPEAIRTRTFDTLKQMSLNGSQQRPLIFEIEDLHWVDQTSETYLASLVDSLPGASILLLTSYRPGYQPLMKLREDQMPFVEQYAQEALQLAHHTGNRHLLAQSLTRLGMLHQTRGNLHEANRHMEESLQISRDHGYTDALAQNLLWLHVQAYWQGRFHRAIQCGQESVALSRAVYDGISEVMNLAFFCLAYGSVGAYAQAFSSLQEGIVKAKARQNFYFLGRLINSWGWLQSELGDIAHALEYDQESTEIGRAHSIPNVEISALINIGLDYLALGHPERAGSYLAPTLERVEREALGSHRWRWKIRLCIGLAELFYTTGDYNQAFRYVEESLKEAQATSSQKYVALGWALRGKIVAKLGNTDAAGIELQRAFSLAEQLQSPSLLYPIAYDLGHWHETTGKEREAAALYGKAKATIEQMVTAVEDDALRSTFLQSALVQEIYERATRLGE